MSVMPKDYEDLRRYLLGRLPQAEAERLEDRFEEDDLFTLAKETETDLLVEYFLGKLAAEEGQGLVRRLSASPAGRRRIEIARTLAGVLDSDVATAVDPPQPAPATVVVPFRPRKILARPAARAAMAAALVGMVLGVWQIHEGRNRPPGGHRVLPGDGRMRVNSGGGLILPPPSPVPASIDLALNRTRGGGKASLPTLDLDPDKTLVELRFKLRSGEPFTSYRVSVKGEGGGTLTRDLKASQDHLVVPLAAAELPDGTYEVRVRGVSGPRDSELLGAATFHVVRRSL